ncbi:unnamed protein product [Ceutorhynchus assimilis]|uniref:Tetraspanin n=1 Tax=Ceutorhynchus assimilis TaxID=467358 RepID=A0A9N9MEX7_9CUCU|nr:unnamed protein product [Ceutorhynchus assimilis]
MVSLKSKEIFCLIYSGLLFISGLILIGLASYLLFKIFYHYTFIPSGTVGPFSVIFILGIAHLFLTWLGIKGPTREHNFHIVLFIIFTIVLLACEFAVGVWSIILWDEVEVESIDLMVSSFDELIKLNYYRKDWNKLQSQLHCCGINGVDDYRNKTDSYPTSCFSNTSMSSVFLEKIEGCKLPLIRYVKRILIDGVIIGFLCAVFQALGVFAFHSFFKTLREDRSERIARRIALQREMSNANAAQQQTQTAVTTAPPSSTSNSVNASTRDAPKSLSNSPTTPS